MVRRSADAAWTSYSRIDEIDPEGNAGFLHLCPDFVIEFKSESDGLLNLKEKMREYIANGAQLGWLIEPARRSVTIYRPGAEPETRAGIDSIAGEGPVAGFVLDLSYVWNPRARRQKPQS